MKLTAKVKLQPTIEQADSLRKTLELANQACNYISERCWATRTFSQFSIQKLLYYEVKERFPGISAQVIILCIIKVCDAYKKDKKTQRTFKPTSSIAFDARILSWKLDANTVSIWTVDGRAKMPFVCRNRAKELLSGKRGESDLVLIKGEFYLFTSCQVDEPTPSDTDDVIGVDMGIANIAVTSDGTVHQGKTVKQVRFRHRRLRTKLQKKGTQSARRLLKKLAGKEQKFATWVNHNISKRIVATAKDTHRGIAIEDLGGIRDGVTVRKSQKVTLHSWSFFQLRSFLEYKSKLNGVPIVAVDPRNTSRTCPCCGHIDKANRKTQAKFLCVSCGFSELADYVAATNIRARGRVALSQPYIPTIPTPSA